MISVLEARAMGGARRAVPATPLYEVHKLVIFGALVGFLAVMVQHWVSTIVLRTSTTRECGIFVDDYAAKTTSSRVVVTSCLSTRWLMSGQNLGYYLWSAAATG